ncbi:hypothetical protein [Fluviicola taffensis]|uniref:hypothetical protein n=1 Tax=Fluviicola taffensis TaxID=191579 RepID=UPI0031381222
MKHFFLTILIALSGITISLAQTGDSSTNANKPVSGETQTQVKTGNPSASNPNLPTTSGSKTIEDIISFLPVAFFLLITSTIFFKLRKDKVKLSDILIDKEAVQEKRKTDASVAIAAVNAGQPAPVAAAPAAQTDGQTTANSDQSQSTSRLIAFICGITSVALACCITSYYFYKSFTGTEDVDLGNLSNVLFGLGLGVIPYGFNKVAAALK